MIQPELLPEAPGAKAARHCGIWALVTVFLFFPISFILAIIAIVQNNRAKTHARNAPQAYRLPTSTGMILGILSIVIIPVFLFFVGIIAAIAIPAFLGQRNRARDKAAISNMVAGTADLVRQLDQGVELGKTDGQIHQELEGYLKTSGATQKNPWDPTIPAFSYSIAVVEGLDGQGVKEAAGAQATSLGQSVFAIQFPSRPGNPTPRPGFLAGAVQTRTPIQGSTVTSKVVSLD